MRDVKLTNFVINRLSEDQYKKALQEGNIKEDELYVTDYSSGAAGVSEATEEKSGIARIATEEEAIRGIDDNTIMTPLKTKDVVSENVGRLYQLGYTGTLSEGVLTFEQSSDEEPYELKAGYEYLVDLLFEAVGEIDDSIKVIIKNKGNIINLVNVLHDDTVNSITIGDLKQIMKYSTDIGWRWLFKAWYTETQAGEKVLVMPSTVVQSGDIESDKDNTFTGINTFEGDNHPVVIEGMAGTTASGYQIKDSLGAGETDLEHYSTGDRYGTRLLNKNLSTNKDGYIDIYSTNAGISVADLTNVDNVLVPTPSDADSSQRPATTEWVQNKLGESTDLSNYVTKDGDNTFTGANTFEQPLVRNVSNSEILLQSNNTTFTKGDIPSTDMNVGSYRYNDKDAQSIIADFNYIDPQGATRYIKRLYLNVAGSTAFREVIKASMNTSFVSAVDFRGNTNVWMPTPDVDDSSDRPATTAWVRDTIKTESPKPTITYWE